MTSDTTKQFAVNWNNHMNHVKKAFDNLLNNSELTDVTLYAEGKKVGAHKMLLSACSTYFRNLFREFPQEHPIVVLKGISYSVLADILKFIYNGEVSVDTDVFDSFLQTAEFLQISGLTDGGKNSKKAQNGDRDTVREESRINEEESDPSTENKATKKEKRSNMDTEQITQVKRVKESNAEMEYAIKCEPGVLTAIFPDELSDTLQEGSQFPPELLLQAAGSNNYSVDDTNIKGGAAPVHFTPTNKSQKIKWQHELTQVQGEKHSIRKYCKHCYTNMSEKEGRRVAKNKTKKVTTMCRDCEGQPFLCVECFNKSHETPKLKIMVK